MLKGKVRKLSNEGDDDNIRDTENRNKHTTLLFSAIKEARGVQLIRKHLNNGADVRARDNFNFTPLHYAVVTGDVDIVKVLVKHGGDANAGTPLFHFAVNTMIKDVESVEQELFKHSANVNSALLIMALDNVKVDLEFHKLLIKVIVIKHFDTDYKKITKLHFYTGHPNYGELSSFLDDCACEIVKMKTDRKLNDNLSLYQFMILKDANRAALYTNKGVRNFADHIISNYPIYQDIISPKIKSSLERSCLLEKLIQLKVCLESYTFNRDEKKTKVILDFYSTNNIASYLSNVDLLNFVNASSDFSNHTGQSSSNSNSVELIELPNRLDEASTSHCAKRARLA